MFRQGPSRIDGYVNRKTDETPADDSQRDSFDRLTPRHVQIVMESPKECRTGCDFDQTIQAEADERHGTGEQTGDDRDESFEGVVSDA